MAPQVAVVVLGGRSGQTAEQGVGVVVGGAAGPDARREAVATLRLPGAVVRVPARRVEAREVLDRLSRVRAREGGVVRDDERDVPRIVRESAGCGLGEEDVGLGLRRRPVVLRAPAESVRGILPAVVDARLEGLHLSVLRGDADGSGVVYRARRGQ